MAITRDPKHRLVIEDRSAKTLCGLSVIVFYPASDTGLTGEGKRIDMTTMNNRTTCEECKKGLGENMAVFDGKR